MAAYGYDAFTEKQNELAFDLRQIYVKIVAEHLEDIADARRARNYEIYFRALRNLETIIRHKIKDKKIIDKDGKKINCLDYYEELIKKAMSYAAEHPGVWKGRTSNPYVVTEFENLLNEIEKLLWDKMEDAKMFGSGQTFEGL